MSAASSTWFEVWQHGETVERARGNMAHLELGADVVYALREENERAAEWAEYRIAWRAYMAGPR